MVKHCPEINFRERVYHGFIEVSLGSDRTNV